MKEYILYIVIGLAIAGVIAVYFITNKKIENLEKEIVNMNNNFLKISSIVNSNNRIVKDDPFDNTVNNIQSAPTGYSETGMNYGENLEMTSNQSDISKVSSTGKLKDEIADLRKDIGNIEDLIEDSSGESSQSRHSVIENNINSGQELYGDADFSDDIDPQDYNNQLAGIQPESIDEDIINKVNSINQNSIDINFKHTSSEFDDLGNTEIENNSELNNILDTKGKSVDKIAGEIQSLEDNLKDLTLNKISLEKNNETTEAGNTEIDKNINQNNTNLQSTDNSEIKQSPDNSGEINTLKPKKLKVKKLNDIEAQVIADKYSKKDLEKICNELSISKTGTKKKMVHRIHKTGYSFKNNGNSISNNLSVN